MNSEIGRIIATRLTQIAIAAKWWKTKSVSPRGGAKAATTANAEHEARRPGPPPMTSAEESGVVLLLDFVLDRSMADLAEMHRRAIGEIEANSRRPLPRRIRGARDYRFKRLTRPSATSKRPSLRRSRIIVVRGVFRVSVLAVSSGSSRSRVAQISLLVAVRFFSAVIQSCTALPNFVTGVRA